jgi:hypothetical protein
LGWGEGLLTAFERVRAGIALALIVGFALLSFTTIADAAGALAIGKCGAYGQAFDFPTVAAAMAAARQQCAGDCTTITMKRACAALAIDLKNPCGAHGYAVRSRISSSLNEAARKCYEFGGADCVIRAWACDAKG